MNKVLNNNLYYTTYLNHRNLLKYNIVKRFINKLDI